MYSVFQFWWDVRLDYRLSLSLIIFAPSTHRRAAPQCMRNLLTCIDFPYIDPITRFQIFQKEADRKIDGPNVETSSERAATSGTSTQKHAFALPWWLEPLSSMLQLVSYRAGDGPCRIASTISDVMCDFSSRRLAFWYSSFLALIKSAKCSLPACATLPRPHITSWLLGAAVTFLL